MAFRKFIRTTVFIIATVFFAVANMPAYSLSTMSSAAKQKLELSVGSTDLRKLVIDAANHDVTQTLDVNGILWMEHINLIVGSKPLAEFFFMDFLGFTKDASSSFHVNLGQQQFHLAAKGDPPQRIAGSVGIVVPDLGTLRTRIPAAVETLSKETQFRVVHDETESITLICPWGNIIHVYSASNDSLESSVDSPHKMVKFHADGGSYGVHRMAIRGNPGIRYIEFACPSEKTTAIAQFYREMLGCTVMETTTGDENKNAAIVCVGPGVHLAFIENESLSEKDKNDMEGVHVCFYANDFKKLYQRLKARNLIWTNPRFVHLDTCDTWEEAFASRTLRFKDIIDLNTGEKIMELEHETRPLRHGQYLKVPRYEPK